MMNKKKSLLLLIAWMIVIFIFSSMNGDMSSDLSFKTTWLFFWVKDPETLKIYHYFVRKAAHVVEYLILTGLAYNYFRFTSNDIKKIYLYSFLVSFTYAISDEVHQLFVSDRAGAFSDVLVDLIGVLLFLIFMFIKNKYASSRKSS